MVQRIKKIGIYVFVLLLTLPTICWSAYEMVVAVNPEYKEIFDPELGENRYLKSFPATFSNAYGSEIDASYNDHVPFRANIILLNREVDKAIAEPYTEGKNLIVGKIYNTLQNGNLGGGPGIEEKEEEKFLREYIGNIDYEKYPFLKDDIPNPPSNEYLEPVVSNKFTIIGRDKWLFFAGDNYVDYYLKKNVLTPQEMDQYVLVMNKLVKKCKEKGKQILFVVPPNKSQVYGEFMPSYQDMREGLNQIETLQEYLVATSSEAKLIYPRKELIACKPYFNDYKRYDTHYNEMGGYIVGKVIADAIGGVYMPPIASCSVVKNNPKDSYDLIAVGNLNKDDYQGEYEYNLGYENFPSIEKYETLGDEKIYPYIYMHTPCGEKRKMCIIGDSFRYFLASSLGHVFDDCYVLFRDENMGSEKEYRDAVLNSDIIVFEVLERFSPYLIKHGEVIYSILEGQDSESR